ncbi:MAG: hypothetical protein ACXWC6_03130 [Ramlibacter sp.]
MARRKAPVPKSADNRPRGSNAPGHRSGQGASSALAEMLRRQAQNPKPAGQPPGSDAPGAREHKPGPRKPHG